MSMNAAVEHISVTRTLSVPTQLVHITVLVNQDTLVTEHYVKAIKLIY